MVVLISSLFRIEAIRTRAFRVVAMSLVVVDNEKMCNNARVALLPIRSLFLRTPIKCSGRFVPWVAVDIVIVLAGLRTVLSVNVTDA